MKLILLPPAGTASAEYRSWEGAFPGRIQLRPVMFPGRAHLSAEPAIGDVGRLVAWLIDHLRDDLGGPFAIYGHSMGALVAYELVHGLRDRGWPRPAHLFVGARDAPHMPHPPALSDLDDDGLVAALQGRYDSLPQAALDDPEVLARFLPILRADYTLLDTYRWAERPPLETAITAFRGMSDPTVTRAEMLGWKQHTAGDFELHEVHAGHFFHREVADFLADRISAVLLR